MRKRATRSRPARRLPSARLSEALVDARLSWSARLPSCGLTAAMTGRTAATNSCAMVWAWNMTISSGVALTRHAPTSAGAVTTTAARPLTSPPASLGRGHCPCAQGAQGEPPPRSRRPRRPRARSSRRHRPAQRGGEPHRRPAQRNVDEPRPPSWPPPAQRCGELRRRAGAAQRRRAASPSRRRAASTSCLADLATARRSAAPSRAAAHATARRTAPTSRVAELAIARPGLRGRGALATSRAPSRAAVRVLADRVGAVTYALAR
jgi:hypothetical protein